MASGSAADIAETKEIADSLRAMEAQLQPVLAKVGQTTAGLKQARARDAFALAAPVDAAARPVTTTESGAGPGQEAAGRAV